MINYYNKNIKFNRQALKEVYEIITDYEEEDLERIPEKIIKVIEDNMDKDYIFDIDNLENIELLPDTKRIITHLYTEFVAQGEEREVLKQIEKIQREQYIANKKQSHENIFENAFPKEEKNISKENLPVVKEKEGLFEKIRNFIKRHLKK